MPSGSHVDSNVILPLSLSRRSPMDPQAWYSRYIVQSVTSVSQSLPGLLTLYSVLRLLVLISFMTTHNRIVARSGSTVAGACSYLSSSNESPHNSGDCGSSVRQAGKPLQPMRGSSRSSNSSSRSHGSGSSNSSSSSNSSTVVIAAAPHDDDGDDDNSVVSC
jgi:hypothetical protein